MSHDAGTCIDEGRIDLVPMIDCIMLLLIFFVLTSRFTSEELRIAALLPTQGAVGPPGPVVVMPPPTVRIAVLPAADGAVRVRLGGGPDLILDAAALAGPAGAELDEVFDGFHAAIAARLTVYEQPGGREAQHPVEIHCASRLPWRCALVTYDAVRAYERSRLPSLEVPIDVQRSVAFAAPAVRNTGDDRWPAELDRLERLR